MPKTPETCNNNTLNRFSPYYKAISKDLLTPCRQVGLSRKKKATPTYPKNIATISEPSGWLRSGDNADGVESPQLLEPVEASSNNSKRSTGEKFKIAKRHRNASLKVPARSSKLVVSDEPLLTPPVINSSVPLVVPSSLSSSDESFSSDDLKPLIAPSKSNKLISSSKSNKSVAVSNGEETNVVETATKPDELNSIKPIIRSPSLPELIPYSADDDLFESDDDPLSKPSNNNNRADTEIDVPSSNNDNNKLSTIIINGKRIKAQIVPKRNHPIIKSPIKKSSNIDDDKAGSKSNKPSPVIIRCEKFDVAAATDLAEKPISIIKIHTPLGALPPVVGGSNKTVQIETPSTNIKSLSPVVKCLSIINSGTKTYAESHHPGNNNENNDPVKNKAPPVLIITKPSSSSSSRPVKRSLSLKKSISNTSDNSDQREKTFAVVTNQVDMVDDSQLLVEKINKLERIVKDKREHLDRLKQVGIYRRQNDVQELDALTDKWKQGCILALNDLLGRLQMHATIDMATLLDNLRVPSHMVSLLPDGELQ